MLGLGFLEMLADVTASGFTAEMLLAIRDKKDDETITVKEIKNIFDKQQKKFLDKSLKTLRDAINNMDKEENKGE